MASRSIFIIVAYISLYCVHLHAELHANSTELSTALGESKIKAAAEFSQVSFVSADATYFGADENSQSLTSMGVGVRSTGGRGQVEGHWFYVPQEEFHYFNIPELSYEIVSGESEFWIGRHKYTWSKADEFWQSGVWQPRFMWDYLNPEQNGLTGVFYSTRLDASSKIHLFVSGLFLPDIAPQFREIDGKIVAKNPWIRNPPPLANLFSEDTPIVVHVDRPDNREIIFRPSLALQYLKTWSGTMSSQVAYAYKPVNNLRMSYAYFLHTKDSTTEAVVTAHPSFPYEQVVTAESTYAKDDYSITAGVTHQNPVYEEVPFQNISQEITPATMGSLIFNKYVDEQSATAGHYYFGIIKTWTKTSQDLGENVPEDSLFILRQQFYMAYRAGVEMVVHRYRGRPVMAQIEGTYDSDQEAAIFNASVYYKMKLGMDIRLAVNLLGATSSDETEYENGMIRTYRANDNMNLGMSYVF